MIFTIQRNYYFLFIKLFKTKQTLNSFQIFLIIKIYQIYACLIKIIIKNSIKSECYSGVNIKNI